MFSMSTTAQNNTLTATPTDDNVNSSGTSVKARFFRFAQKFGRLVGVVNAEKTMPSSEQKQSSTKPLEKYRVTAWKKAFRIISGAGAGFLLGAACGAIGGSLAMMFASPVGAAIGASVGGLVCGLVGGAIGLGMGLHSAYRTPEQEQQAQQEAQDGVDNYWHERDLGHECQRRHYY